MEGNFSRCLTFVLSEEGGYSDHPHDGGGATFRGVTLRAMRDHFGGDPSADDLQKLTLAQIAEVFHQDYWGKCGAGMLPAGLDLAVFDFAINSGPGRPGRALQRLLGVAEDGIIGPVTVAAAQRSCVPLLVHELCFQRLIFVQGLWNWVDFGRGWSSRILRCHFASLRLCDQPLRL